MARQAVLHFRIRSISIPLQNKSWQQSILGNNPQSRQIIEHFINLKGEALQQL